ncbi:hypothetical protein C7W93_11095 [Glaciimonas sp. PCH181]|nr:hypothetical protein C7W93_11095 [Glaciimonas sp. PCH181]
MRLPQWLMPGQFPPASNRQINAYCCCALMQTDHPEHAIALTGSVDAIAQLNTKTIGLAR